MEITAVNLHGLTSAAKLLHGEEEVVYADAGYQGIEKRPEMEDKSATFRVAMRLGKRRALPNRADGRLDDLIATAKPQASACGRLTSVQRERIHSG